MPIVNGINLDDYDFEESSAKDSSSLYSDSPKETVNGIDLSKYDFGEEKATASAPVVPPLTDDEGFLKETFRAGVRGGYGLGEMFGNLAKYVDYDTGKAITDWANKGADEYSMGKETSGTFVKKGVLEGVESMPASVAAGLPGAIAGATVGSAFPGLGTWLGGAIGYGLSGGSVMGLAEYQNYLDEYRKATGKEPDASTKGMAGLSALAEGGFEGISGFLEGLTIGAGRGIIRPAATTLKELLKAPLKTWAKRFVKVEGIEVSTEMATAYSQASLRKAQGLPTMEPLEAAKAAIIPALTMGTMFTLGGAGLTRLHRMNMENNLINPDVEPQDRAKAVEYVADLIKNEYGEIGRIDTGTTDEMGNPVYENEIGNLWKKYGEERILAGEPISLDFELDKINLEAQMLEDSVRRSMGLKPDDLGETATPSEEVSKTEGGGLNVEGLQTETEGQLAEPTIPQGEDIKTEPPMADASKEIASSPSSFFGMPKIGTQNVVKAEKTPSTLPLTELSEEGMANPPSTPEKTSQEANAGIEGKEPEFILARLATPKEKGGSKGRKAGFNTVEPKAGYEVVYKSYGASGEREGAGYYYKKVEAKANVPKVQTVGKSSKEGVPAFKTIQPTTKNGTVKFNVANTGEDFLISTPSGAKIDGYVKNADFPGAKSSPTRGEIFYSEVPTAEQKQGTGMALHIDALNLLKANGVKTVNMSPITPAGRAVVDKLIREGYISKALRISETGKAEHKILDKKPKAEKVEKKETPTIKQSLTVQKEETLESYVRKHKINFNIPGHTNKEAISDGLLSYTKNDAVGLDKAAEEMQGLGLLGATPDGYATAGDYLYAELQKIVYDRINKKAQSLTAEEDQAIKEMKEALKRDGYDESGIEREESESDRTGKKEAYSIKDSETDGEAQSLLEADEEFVKEEETPTDYRTIAKKVDAFADGSYTPEDLKEIVDNQTKLDELDAQVPVGTTIRIKTAFGESILHKSSKKESTYQISRFDTKGEAIGDSEYTDYQKAVKDLRHEQGSAVKAVDTLLPIIEKSKTEPETKTPPTKELFDTSSMFTLSGNQPVEQKSMKVPEKKGERLLDVPKQTTDELKDRLSGGKAKRELEEGKKTVSLKVVDDIAAAEALLEQKETEYFDAEESGKSPEELKALWASVTEQQKEVYRLRTARLRGERLEIIKSKERKLANIEQKIKDGEKIFWDKDWEPDTRIRSVAEARQEIQEMKDNISFSVTSLPKNSPLSPKDSQALVSDILSILADGSSINFVEKIDPNRPDIQKALTQWKQGNPGASFVIEGMHRKVIVDGNTMASIIEVSMGSSDIGQTAWHEAWHSIDEIFLTANEKKILAEKLTPNIEKQADIFAKYAANQKHLLPKSAKPIFERIREFFEKVGNYLKDRGFTSAEDVFNRALRGELKTRAQRWAGKTEPAFKIKEPWEMTREEYNQAALDKVRSNTYFHGTSKTLTEGLKTGEGKDKNRYLHEEGIWFAPNRGINSNDSTVSDATRYSGDYGTIVEARLDIKNPYFGDVDNIVSDKINAGWLRENGYDSFIDTYSGSGLVVVLDPKQIREIKREPAGEVSFKIAPVIKKLIDKNAKKAANPEQFPLPADKEFRRLYNEAMGKDYSKAQAYTLTPSYKAYGPNARPEWTANYENFKGAREERQTLNSEFMRKIDNFLNAPMNKTLNVEKVFFEGDATLGQKMRDLHHEAKKVRLGGNLELSKQLREQAKAIKQLNRYSDEELANGITVERTGEVVKLNPEEIAMYKELREGYDSFLRYLLKSMAEVAFDAYSKASWFTSMTDLFSDVTLRQTDMQRKTLRALNKLALNKIRGKKAETIQKNRAALMDVVKEHISTVSGITDQTELSTMAMEMVEAYKKERVSINAVKKARNRIGQIIAYAPRVREQAKVYFNIYKTVKSMSKDGTEKVTKELVANYPIEEKAIYKIKPELRGQAINQMWEEYKSRHKNEDLSYKVDRVTRESDTSYRGVNDINLQRIVDNAITSIKGTRDLTDGPILDGLKNSLVQAVANEMKVRGFGRSLVSRKLQHIEGYKTTGLQKITVDYITGLTGMITKQKSALRAYDILKTVPKKDTVLYEDMAKYAQDMLRNQNGMDRASGKAKGLLFTWYLSGLLKMVPIQLTQNYLTGMPEQAQKMREWGIKGFSEARYHKAMADATTIRVDKKTGSVKPNKRINEFEARLLTESLHNGNTADQYVKYITGLLDTQMSRKATWLLEKLSRPFSMMETFNRESASLSMFRMAWEHYSKDTPNLEERYQKAKHEASRFVSGTHFDFGKENLPRLATGGDAMSIGVKTLMTFRSFNHNYVQFIFGSKDWKTIAHSLAYVALFGGMMGLPFIKDILDLLEKLTGKSYTKAAREVMRKYGGKTLETFGIQGLPALAGANISGSLAMGIPFADWMTGGSASSTVFGVVGGMGEKIAKGINYGLKGELYRAGESLAPEMLASPMKAMRTSAIGKEYLGTTGYDTTSKGKPKFDENGKPLSMDTGDVIAKMMGFNPSGYSMKNEAQRSASNIEEYFSDWHTKIYETYRAGRTNHDPKTIAKALRQIREFNQAIVDKEVVGLIPRIKMSNVVKAAKMEMTKKQKREALYKKNYLAS